MQIPFSLMMLEEFFYAGIGSRKITKNSSYIMMRYACAMAFMGGVVRSGAADGSDTSFEVGAKIAYDAMVNMFGFPAGKYGKVLEVHLPWATFNGRKANPVAGYHLTDHPEATRLAEKHHPAWEHLQRAARGMMQRNSNQVMGLDMQTPSRFIVCETPDGAFTKEMTSGKTGGTGQAIRVANAHSINIYNLKHKEHLNKIMAWLDDSEIKLQAKYGVSPKALVDEFLLTFNGINNRVEGDLVRMANRGEVDVLVHGTNCQAKMASGIAKGVRETFPEAYAAFMTHRKGDRKLLGTVDIVPVQREGKCINIVNAYTQFNYGRDEDTLYVDYEAVRKSFKQVAATFDTKVRIGIPRIGAGLGNGCWVTISNIIAQEMKNHNLVLVDLPENSLEMKAEYQEPEKAEVQMGLF